MSKKLNTKVDTVSLKKEAFLVAFAANFGNVTKSCKAIGIERATYYKWMQQDSDFNAAINAVNVDDLFLDFVEDAFVKNIKSGNTAEILFALKTKGKGRGYVERIETKDVTEKDDTIKVEIVLPKKDEDTGN